MTGPRLEGIASMSLHRNGTTTVTSTDGRTISVPLPPGTFAESSATASCTYLPGSSTLRCETIHGDYIDSEIPYLSDPASPASRPTIYLDQNHWSTLSNAIHDPERVRSATELEAARELIELAKARRVVLPVSAGHMQETCQDGIDARRYQRALTMLQLSGGWRLTDPLALRRIELRIALSRRYYRPNPTNPPAVTLDPGALHRARGGPQPSNTAPDMDSLDQLQETLTTAMAHIDTFLDADSVPAHPVDGWVASIQSFADFLRDNPSGRELLRRRTWAKFYSDFSKELVEESASIGITPAQMSEWTMRHADTEVREMSSLGLYREVIHEKLSDTRLQWESNDLTDMIYLTAAAGYCDQVVGERSHTSHINNGLRRLGRTQNTHRNLRTLLGKLELTEAR